MNPVGALIDILSADAGVAPFSPVFYGGMIPDGTQYLPTPQQPIVEISATGRASRDPGARSTLPWRAIRMEVRCYADSSQHDGVRKADALDTAVWKAMQGIHCNVAANTIVRSATLSGGPIQDRDPDSDRIFTLSTYDVGFSTSE